MNDNNIKNVFIGELSKINIILNNSKCHELSNYLIRKIKAYDFENNKKLKIPDKNGNGENCQYISNEYFNESPDLICEKYLPKEILDVIFKNIPFGEREINFFKTNKYYYQFSYMVHDYFECDFSRKIKYLIDLIPNKIQNVKILKNVDEITIVKYTSNLRVLKLSNDHNESINRIKFPKTLEILHLGSEFNKILDNITLYKYLRVLIFGKSFNKFAHFHLFKQLEVLDVGVNFGNYHVTFPETLKCLKLSKNLGNVRVFDKSEGHRGCYVAVKKSKIDFPRSLESLVLRGGCHFENFYDKIGELQNLRYLGLGVGNGLDARQSGNKLIHCQRFPKSLEELHIWFYNSEFIGTEHLVNLKKIIRHDMGRSRNSTSGEVLFEIVKYCHKIFP